MKNIIFKLKVLPVVIIVATLLSAVPISLVISVYAENENIVPIETPAVIEDVIVPTPSETPSAIEDVIVSTPLETPAVVEDVIVPTPSVVPPVCGNSTIEESEQCDDGNILNGDGCSSTCQTEVGRNVDFTAIIQNNLESMRNLVGTTCEVDVDVVLILDVSGSMGDGAVQSKCEWSEIKPYGSGYAWFLNTKYDITSEWCSSVKDSVDGSVYVGTFIPTNYTPAKNSKITDAKNAAKSFIDNLKTVDQSALVTFSDTAQLLKSLSSDHTATKSAIDSVVVGGATDIGDAIGAAIAELGSSRANPQATKTIILLTDGKANKPNGPGVGEFQADVDYAKQKAQVAADVGYKIFTIGLGADGEINATMLQDIASITGAQYHSAPDGSWLFDIYQEISSEICQYGSISGCKYSDLNNNGAIDPTDTVVPNWEIILSGKTSATQLTDQSGCYTFAGLLAGNYSVSEGENAGKKPYTKTYPTSDSYSVALSSAENVTGKDFANHFPVVVVCGNNTIEEGEQCDDGNTTNGDGCSCTCQTEIILPVCGNNKVEQGEQCDDGDKTNGDGCSSTCQTEIILPVCGNGTIEQGEQCDDGNTIGGDGCSCTCRTEITPQVCGNGAKEEGEQCDDGNKTNGDGCSSTCQSEGTGISAGDIVITEIMQNPAAVSDTFGEWFELYNKTQSSINLLNCSVGRSDTSKFSIYSSLIVPANGYVVLARNGNPLLNGGITPDFVYSGFLMNNGSDKLILICNGTEIDRVEFDGGPNFPNPSGASMILKDVALDNNIGSNWCVSTSAFGSGDKGTPKAVNDSCGGTTAECTSGVQRPCTTGQLGVCSGGTQTCSSQGFWQECVRQTAPSSEICSDGLDNNCDGKIDGADSSCQVSVGGGGGGGGGVTFYSLSAGKSGTGSGLIKSNTGNINCGSSCSDSYSYGSVITLTVTPDVGSTFAGWSGDCSGTDNTCTLSLNGNKKATAIINSEGEVLSESASRETGKCTIYLLEYIKYGQNNNPEEVKKLQTFLNEEMGANLPITGYYNSLTRDWVNKFQVKYKKEVLKPWVDAGLYQSEDTPTSYVYKTTKRWINMIKCPSLNIPTPDFSEDRTRLLGH